jgi:hypothetical protein
LVSVLIVLIGFVVICGLLDVFIRIHSCNPISIMKDCALTILEL